ncbi:MAG: excinuclease ABC subunit UvrC, partial [Chloroflexi bacterium]|nr:excinuclease ABC subunit UvrC [Chloroflexota bacterium]
DNGGSIIYIGKAITLRNRLRSYSTSPSSQPERTRQLVELIADFEYIVTDSEVEALILECTLIKKHRPKYNVMLKDDKSYPYIKVTVQEQWPRVVKTRNPVADGSRYFGPYTSAASVDRTLQLLDKLFLYRDCDIAIDGQRERPCLSYYINRCLGPCAGLAGKEEYDEAVNEVLLFLQGRQEAIHNRLEHRMEEAAADLQFERAAALRDQLAALEHVIQRQKMMSDKRTDEDIIAFARQDSEACVQVFFVREGKLVGKDHFVMQGVRDASAEEILSSFVKQFYDQAAFVPDTLILQAGLEEQQGIAEWLRARKGRKVAIHVPQRGEKRQWIDMVARNAEETMSQLHLKWLNDEQRTTAALSELKEALGLGKLPCRIECYDISNTQGTNAVGSMVVFENGSPKKSDYRRFKIKTVEGSNDFAMMQEVLERRLRRATPKESDGEESTGEPDAWTALPDLLMVDGGKGQLSAALAAMESTATTGVDAIGLAKEHEEIFRPGVADSLVLPSNSPALYLLQRVRDEAHRFAITYHKGLRKEKAFQSPLDQVPGIGPKRKKTLLKTFGSVKRMREASAEEIATAGQMSLEIAQRVKDII